MIEQWIEPIIAGVATLIIMLPQIASVAKSINTTKDEFKTTFKDQKSNLKVRDDINYKVELFTVNNLEKGFLKRRELTKDPEEVADIDRDLLELQEIKKEIKDFYESD
jgi:hypothetical protein